MTRRIVIHNPSTSIDPDSFLRGWRPSRVKYELPPPAGIVFVLRVPRRRKRER